MRHAAAGLAAAAALTGCSGTGEDFERRANAICKEKRAEIATIRRPGALTLFEGYLERVLPLLREQREEVDGFDGGSDESREMIEKWGTVLDALGHMQRGARAGSDIDIAIGLRRAAAAEREADEAARAAGLSACTGFNPLTRT